MPRKKKIALPKPVLGMDISSIIATTKLHNGFAKLSSSQRRLLIAAILASVVPCDGKVLDVELQHYLGHLKTHYQFSPQDQAIAMQFLEKGFNQEELMQAARQLTELLSVEDRAKLIGLMWDIACADQDLHKSEAELIFKIADGAGVVRKRAVEEQAKAARANGLGPQPRAA